jgi:hypothetical protein
MAKHVFIAFSDPKEGMEDEFNEWYDNQHVPDLMKLPGFVRASRYKLAEGVDTPTGPNASPAAPNGQRYVVIYEIEADDVAYVPGAIRAGIKAGEVILKPVMNDLNSGYFTQISSTD